MGKAIKGGYKVREDLSNKELKQQEMNYNKYLDSIIKEDRR